MKIKGVSEKQEKFAKDIFGQKGIGIIIEKTLLLSYEETSYKSEASFNNSRKALKDLLEEQIEAKFIIENRELNSLALISKINTAYNKNQEYTFDRLLLCAVKKLDDSNDTYFLIKNRLL